MRLPAACFASLGLALAFASAPAHAETPAPADAPSLDVAIRSARETGKPLLVEFYADWCKPCRQFEQTTMPDPRVIRALEAVTFVRYNAEQAPGQDVAARYDIDSYPTFLAIDRAGVERLRHEGALVGEAGIKQFVGLIGQAQAAVLDEAAIKARLAAAPASHEVRLAAARWYAMHDRPGEALRHYDVVARSTARGAIRSEAWAAAARIRRLERWRRQLVDEKVERIRRFPSDATSDDLAIATVGSGLPADEVRSIFAIVMLRTSDPDDLNSVVYVAIAAGALDEALYGATRAVGLARDAQHLDTLAEVHHARGEHADAVRVAGQALALARGTAIDAVPPSGGLRAPANPGLAIAKVIAANRARFAARGGPAREVRQYRLRTQDLWQRTEQTVDVLAKRVRDPDDERQQNQVRAEARAAMDVERKLERELASTCKADAGGVESALVRATLDPATGRIVASVQLHEAGATEALRKCLDRGLAAAVLPGPASMKKRTLSLWFSR